MDSIPYWKEREIMQAKIDSPLRKLYPKIWTQYEYGGEVLLEGKYPAWVWIPIDQRKKDEDS